MNAKSRWSNGDRKIFRRVQKAVHINPSTEQRNLINRRLCGLPEDQSETEYNQKGVYEVRRRADDGAVRTSIDMDAG